MTEQFFDETSEQSEVKAAIVAKYFWVWAKVVIPSAKKRGNKIAYIDLFAGPGRYEDGTKSTPLLILEQAIEDPDMREMLVAIFNDGDPKKAGNLKEAIASLDGIEKLRHQPRILNKEIGNEIAKQFEGMSFVPTLFFVDPWGYKGLSLRLINSVLKDWGCDCIFFFNYNRINMGLMNAFVVEPMNALFGDERAEHLRNRLDPMTPAEREIAIVDELAKALQEFGGKYVLPFCFKNALGSRTSHHLIFVSKHVRGYEIMKDIMAKESSTAEQGVPSFHYSLADKKYPLLFDLSRPLDDLADLLAEEFAGKSLKMVGIYNRHHIGKPYIKKNYKEVLAKMELERRIAAKPPAEKRPRRNGKPTFSDTVSVTFPQRGD